MTGRLQLIGLFALRRVSEYGRYKDKAEHQWQNRNYKPSPGDIIIIDWYADGTRDHVGLVEKCDGKTVYTIEGNRSDAVKRGSYRVGSGTIYGYVVPRY